MTTLVGIFPDNINLPEVPAAIPKLSVYTRINLDPTRDEDVTVFLRFPDGREEAHSVVDKAVIEKAKEKAREFKSPVAGLVSRISSINFSILSVGRIEAVVNVGGQEYITGSLNIGVATED